MRRALGFTGRFLLAYAVVVALWLTGLERRYNDYLAWAAGRAACLLEQPRLTTMVRRSGNLLVAEHAPYFSRLEPQEIVTRRVHSNTALFVALTVATPATSWVTRGLWLAGGGLVLSASHLAHVVAYVQHHYALHNVGSYFTTVRIDRRDELTLAERWQRPATLRRDAALSIANVFNIVLQRAVPIALWLPLFLWQWSPSRGLPKGPRRARARSRRLAIALGATLAAVGVATAAVLLLTGERRGAGCEAVEGVRPGMSAVAAKRLLEARGYDWTPSLRCSGGAGPQSAVAAVWAHRGPFTEARWGPRYNAVVLRLELPPAGGPTGIFAACVGGIETVPSDARPERCRLGAKGTSAACMDYWRTLGAGG